MSDLAHLVIDWIPRSAVVAFSIGILLFCCRKWTSPSLRFVLLQATFFSVCLIPLIGQFLPTIGVIPRVEVIAPTLEPPHALLPSSSQSVAPTASVVADRDSTDRSGPFPVFAMVWLAGSLLLFARLGRSAVALSRLGRRPTFREEAGVRIVLGESGARPMIWGVVRPVIGLPAEAANWPQSTFSAVVAHELAHRARRDPFWLLLSEFVLAVAWINPVLWALKAWQNVERERAADDHVLTQTPIRASDYAEALTRLGDRRWNRSFPIAPAIALGSSIGARALRAVDGDVPRKIPGRGKIIYLVVNVLAITAVTAPRAKEAVESVDLQVVIDPGHGAHDSGARREGFQEKDLNLKLSNLVALGLREAGVPVVFTREDDRFLTLNQRVEIANEAAARFDGETILISIHHNVGQTNSESGIELYVMEGDEVSAPLGELIGARLRLELGSDDVTIKASRMRLLREATVPRVMIEAGYMSNPGDLAKITSDDYQELMGEAIVSGILRRYEAKKRAEMVDKSEMPLVGGFDFPVGNGEGHGFYTFRTFKPNGHLGDDFNGIGGGNSDLGLPVSSIGDGVVVFAKDVQQGWGNVVITRHRYRDASTGSIETIDALYGHLAVIDVKKGERVGRGQIVGTIGRGPQNMYAAHLHFEIRKNLEIGIDRGSFTRGYENYHSPSRFIREHRRPEA